MAIGAVSPRKSIMSDGTELSLLSDISKPVCAGAGKLLKNSKTKTDSYTLYI